ncbi:MAG: ANTAR domain-containing protein [Ruminococcus flavefaciens]|nr:ANTAR domain-containing protein [Ruminococcus flavefaciens]
MENVLIISSNKSAGDTLSDFIREAFGCNIRTAETAQQAKSIFDANAPCDLAVIYSPLSDEYGTSLAEYIIENTASNCILIAKSENAEKFRERAEKIGIITIGRPFNKSFLYQTVKIIDIAMHRSYKLYEETVRLERRIDEIRTIDKAKFMLMQYRDMTEDEAHVYIEQYAMNRRKKKVISALEIIDKINEQYL